MPTSRKLTALLFTLSLAGCEHCPPAPPTPAPSDTAATIAALRPLVALPPGPNLEPVKFDFPRDLSAPPVRKNSAECLSAPTLTTRCVEQPFTDNSNLYIGLDYTNWLVYQRNLVELDTWVRMVRARIDSAQKVLTRPGENTRN